VSHVLLVLGGARSGKSAYAERRLHEVEDVTYVATMLPGDPEVDARIAAHRARRPASWRTVDAGAHVVAALRTTGVHDALLLDGFELAMSLAEPRNEAAARTLAEDVAAAVRSAARTVAVVVSAEAGLGVVPSTAAGFFFRDRLGAANQVLAENSNEVVLVVAGLPLWLKGSAQ